MQTTNLFVELIVIGVGGDLWLGLVVLSVFGYSWVPLGMATSLPGLIPALAATYLLGILIDRMADWAFSSPASRLRRRAFQSREAYERARTLVYASDALRSLAEYALSRMRICRGWVLNSVLGVLSVNLFVWGTLPSHAPKLKLATFGTSILLAVGGTALYSWYELLHTYYHRLAQQGRILSDQRARSSE